MPDFALHLCQQLCYTPTMCAKLNLERPVDESFTHLVGLWQGHGIGIDGRGDDEPAEARWRECAGQTISPIGVQNHGRHTRSHRALTVHYRSPRLILGFTL